MQENEFEMTSAECISNAFMALSQTMNVKYNNATIRYQSLSPLDHIMCITIYICAEIIENYVWLFRK